MTTTPANDDTARRARVMRTVWVLAAAAVAAYSLLFVMAARG